MNTKHDSPEKKLVIDGSQISVDQIVSAALRKTIIEIDSGKKFANHINASRNVLIRALEQNMPVYGVTTGFGKCCGKRMISEVAEKNGLNLIRFHGCGTGKPFGQTETRAAMICRLICFSRGYSGVSIELMEKIAQFLNAGITPVIPSEGSVGASGDLTPMSYVAAALMGERQVFYQGQLVAAKQALDDAGINPHKFFPKEPLAIMNGTAMMTGIAAMVTDRAKIEANSANDNPLFDPDSKEVLMGGNFYGGHVAFAMDGLKSAMASVADMADRQVALMVDANVNRGLPADLVRIKGDEQPFHHGFKAMSIAASALAAEALKETMPAASFSRSTESHNQDKVSMGTIAARDAMRVCSLAEKTLAICLLAAIHACEIRGKLNDRPNLAHMAEIIREIAGPTIKDSPMDGDIANLCSAIKNSEIFS